jgi:hypothetical protein
MASVGVGRDTTSVISPKQPVTNTTVRGECVSYLNEFEPSLIDFLTELCW